jgi:hypothetical protein
VLGGIPDRRRPLSSCQAIDELTLGQSVGPMTRRPGRVSQLMELSKAPVSSVTSRRSPPTRSEVVGRQIYDKFGPSTRRLTREDQAQLS